MNQEDEYLKSLENRTDGKPKGNSEEEEAQKAASAAAAKPNEGVDAIDFSKFAEKFGFPYKSPDELKMVIDKATGLETTVKTVTEELTAYKQFAEEAVDPMSYFANENSFYVNNALKKFPNLPQEVAVQLVASDVKGMDDFEALVIREVVKHSDIGLSISEAEAKVLRDLKIESREELETMSAMEKKLLQANAKEAKAFIASEQTNARVKPEVRTPADFLAKHREAKELLEKKSKEAYEPLLDGIIEQVKAPIKEGDETLFSFTANDEYMKDLRSYLIENIGKQGLGVSDAEKQEVLTNARYKYIGDNFTKILKAYRTEIDTAWQKQVDEKYNNHKPTNLGSEAKPSGAQTMESVIEDMTKGIPSRGWGRS